MPTWLDFESAAALFGALVAGATLVLAVVAPRTKATWDDKLLALLQKVSLIKKVAPK